MLHYEKKCRLNDSHIQKLTEFVRSIREENSKCENIPFVDPDDGGENAKLLIVLQAPGGNAEETEFISRDNNDYAANETKELLAKSGLKREETILWNIVPWAMQNPKKKDTKEGIPYLLRLIAHLNDLRAIVLAGEVAQTAKKHIQNDFQVFECYLPGGQHLKRNPHLVDGVLQIFQEVRDYIHQD